MAWITRRFQPSALPPGVVVTLNVVVALLAIIRGADWIDVGDPAAFSSVLLGLDVPLRAWGISLIGSGTLLIAAMATRVHAAVWFAHGLMFAIYAGLTFNALRAVIAVDGAGYYNLVPFVGGLIWHAVMAKVTGARPPRHSGASVGQQLVR